MEITAVIYGSALAGMTNVIKISWELLIQGKSIETWSADYTDFHGLISPVKKEIAIESPG